MKKELITLLLSTLAFSINAQNSAVGVWAGGNLYNLSKFSENIDYRAKVGTQMGVNFHYFFKNKFFFHTNLGIVDKGHKIVREDISYLYDSDGKPYSVFDAVVRSNFVYVSSLVAVGYKIPLKKDHFLSVSLGISPNYLLTANSTVSTNSTQIEKGKVDLGHVKKFDLSGVVNLGYSMPICTKFSLNVNFNYTQGFLAVFEPGFKDDLRSVHNGLSLNFGVNYLFGS